VGFLVNLWFQYAQSVARLRLEVLLAGLANVLFGSPSGVSSCPCRCASLSGVLFAKKYRGPGMGYTAGSWGWMSDSVNIVSRLLIPISWERLAPFLDYGASKHLLASRPK